MQWHPNQHCCPQFLNMTHCCNELARPSWVDLCPDSFADTLPSKALRSRYFQNCCLTSLAKLRCEEWNRWILRTSWLPTSHEPLECAIRFRPPATLVDNTAAGCRRSSGGWSGPLTGWSGYAVIMCFGSMRYQRVMPSACLVCG